MMLLATLLALLAVTSMNVHYGYSNVTVTINYELNGIQKLGVFLFGANQIKDEITKLINGTNFEIEKVDINQAVLKFNTTNCGNYVYFKGVKLNQRVNMTLTFPNNVTLFLNNSDEIPAVYMFMFN